MSGTLIGEGRSNNSNEQSMSLLEFLQPFSRDNLFLDEESLFTHLFNTIAQSLSIVDFVELFSGQSSSMNRLLEPLQRFVRERVLEGREATDENLDTAVDRFIQEIQPHLEVSINEVQVCKIFIKLFFAVYILFFNNFF